MPWDKRATVENRLRSLLTSERWHHKYGGLPIRGVLANQMGEGGLIVKVKKGRGLVRLKGGGEHPVSLKSVTVGAQIGGSSEWGFGLVMELQDPSYFGGDYSGGTVSATMTTAERDGLDAQTPASHDWRVALLKCQHCRYLFEGSRDLCPACGRKVGSADDPVDEGKRTIKRPPVKLPPADDEK